MEPRLKGAQQPGETTAMFLVQSRRLTEHCEFGATWDELICERFVYGVHDIRIQRRLLAEQKLTLKRVLDVALAIEAAEKNYLGNTQGWLSRSRCSSQVNHEVDKVGEINCYRCGGPYYPKSCHFKDAKCYNCGKLGHSSRVYQARKENKHPRLVQISPILLRLPTT